MFTGGRWGQKPGFLPLRVALCVHLLFPPHRSSKTHCYLVREGRGRESVFYFLPSHVFLTPGSHPLGHVLLCPLPSSWGTGSQVLRDSHYFAVFFSSQEGALLLLLFLDEVNMQ